MNRKARIQIGLMFNFYTLLHAFLHAYFFLRFVYVLCISRLKACKNVFVERKYTPPLKKYR